MSRNMSLPCFFCFCLTKDVLFSHCSFHLQPDIEEWSSWDEEAPTSIKIEGGNGNVPPPANEMDEEPDYFKDMAPTIRKTQKVHSYIRVLNAY